MLSARKVTLVPPKVNDTQQIGAGFEDEENGALTTVVEKSTDKNKIKKFMTKYIDFIKVILKLARTIGYDDDLRIKLRSGKYLEKSNIVDLLTHAMSAGKVLYGEEEFVELLSDCDVDPNLIINDNVRNKLIQLKNRNKDSQVVKDRDVIARNLTSPKEIETRSPKMNAVKKGAKKFIKEAETEPQRKYKLVEVNRDGPPIEIDPNSDMESEEHSNKRKRDKFEEEDSVDDDLIDGTKWKTN